MLKICLGTIVSLCLSVAWAQDPSLVCAEGGCIQPGITTQATSQAAFSREAASDITVVDAAAIGGNSLSFFKNYFVTGDYAVAGVGLRGRGVGGFAPANINMAGVPANLSRPDVGSFLGDNGLHGFSIATPSSLKTNTTHSVSAKFGGTPTQLPSSPKSLSCP